MGQDVKAAVESPHSLPPRQQGLQHKRLSHAVRRDLLVVQRLRIRHPGAGAVGLIPVQETTGPHAAGQLSLHAETTAPES